MCHTHLSKYIDRYITLNRSLGRKYQKEIWALNNLNDYLIGKGARDLDADLFDDWCAEQRHLKSGVLRARMRVVRNLCLYQQRTEPQCFIPNKWLFPIQHQHIRPHIVSPVDIGKLLIEANKLKSYPSSPVRPQTFRLAVILLYTTGLRHGELRHLNIGDYDKKNQCLLVRESKYHKSRYLALSESTGNELEHYLQTRRQHSLPVSSKMPLIGHGSQGEKYYSDVCIRRVIQDLYKNTKSGSQSDACPRVQDFRHSFAVNVLLRWYNNGENVHAKLPLLATYMGHISIVSTAYYLPFINEISGSASDRFAEQYGDLVKPIPKISGV